MPDPTSPSPSSRRTSSAATAPPIAGRVGQGYTYGIPPEPMAPKPPALAVAPDPVRLFLAFRRRWVLALTLGLTLAGLLGAAAWTGLAPKQPAFVYIRINARNPGILAPQGIDSRYEFNTFVKSQIAQLRSRFVLNTALNREEVKRLNLEKKVGSDVINWLESELKVESAADSEMVKLLVSCDDPEDARILVNAIAQTYIKEVVEKEEQAKAARVSELDRIYTQENGKLRDKKNVLRKQVDEYGTMDSLIVQQKLAGLQSELSDTRARHRKLTGDILQLRGSILVHKAGEAALDKFTIPDTVLADAVERDPYIRGDIAQVENLKRRLANVKNSFIKPEREPIFAQLQGELSEVEKRSNMRRAELKSSLEAKAKERAKDDWQQTLRRLDTTLAALVPQEDLMRKETERLGTLAQKIGGYSAEIDTIKAEIRRGEELATDIGKRLELNRYDLLAKPRVGVYHEAALMALERKKQILGAGAGMVIGLGVACMGVSFWEFRRRRVYSPDEVATGLGIPVVGAVPISALVEQLINAPVEENENDPVLIESFDAIRTRLLRGPDDEPARILMVTSASSGEGKTTLASHLASSLSRAGRKTLLIDGDLRMPAVHQFFESNLQPGFSELLLGEVEPVDALFGTNVDGLTILPAGQWDREVIASLARGDVQGMLEKLKHEFDFIVIDSHPVLAANDSLLIGQHVDAVILSVLREVSQTPKVYAAAQRLNGLGIRVLGAVVIGTDPEDVYTPAATPKYSTAAV